jgi:hypothetical protein
MYTISMYLFQFSGFAIRSLLVKYFGIAVVDESETIRNCETVNSGLEPQEGARYHDE